MSYIPTLDYDSDVKNLAFERKRLKDFCNCFALNTTVLTFALSLMLLRAHFPAVAAA